MQDKIIRNLRHKIDSDLSKFTQEALVNLMIESYFVNKILCKVCRSKISSNSFNIDNVNNFYRTGEIFDFLNSISHEKKLILLELREVDESYDSGMLKLYILNPRVKELIQKSLTSNLKEEFEEYIREKNIDDIEFYKLQKIVEDIKATGDHQECRWDIFTGKYNVTPTSTSDSEKGHKVKIKQFS